MTLFILIKKEVSQFFRNKTDVLTMFLFPVFLIVIMGISLNGIMNVDKSIFNNKKVYYRVDDLNSNEEYLILFGKFKNLCEESLEVNFEKVENDNKAKQFVNKGQSIAFINIKKEEYDYYMSEYKEITEQKIFKNIFQSYLNKSALMESIETDTINKIKNKDSLIILEEEGLNINGVDSFTYYTFSILILIMMYISGITSISMYNESAQGIFTRLKISKASNLSIILSKISLGVIIGIIQSVVIYIISTIFLKVNWGENFSQIFVILISFMIFSSVLGISMSMIFVEIKTVNSIINTLIIVLGFLGGLYMPISLISSVSIIDKLSYFTPTYWANISLLSISSGLNFKYAYKSVYICLSISTILMLIGFLARKIKAGGKLA